MNKNRALLLDRDGVINIDHAYVGAADRFEFTPGLFAFLRAARDLGYRLAILTNQSGVARGMYDEKAYAQVTAYMLTALQREQIPVELTLACFEHPEGAITAYARESFWRKPNPGMVLEAIRRLDLNPAHCAFLGDNLRDMQAAQSGGIGHCLWLTTENNGAPPGVTIVKNFPEALIPMALNFDSCGFLKKI
jgi:D-glycero-D-manno-heptose 1,7-bisphosphate phosphatase